MIRSGNVKSKKEACSCYLFIPNYDFKKLIPFLSQKTLPNQTLESYISTTINGRCWMKDLLERGEKC